MPNYRFKCENCGLQKDAIIPSFSKIADGSLIWPRCPQCHDEMEKQPAAPSFKVIGGTPKFHKTGGTK